MTANISPNPSNVKECHFCHKIEEQKGSLKVCSGCKAIYYCSPECQKMDWKVHKILCRQVTEGELYKSPDNALWVYRTPSSPKELFTPRRQKEFLKGVFGVLNQAGEKKERK